VRAANIKTSTGRTNRPITRFILLEVSAQDKGKLDDQSKSISATSRDTSEVVTESRPKRYSARKAQEMLK